MTGASLARSLRALREAAGLSQEELAERAGLSSHAISALERGTRTRPYPHTVRALCDALGVDAGARAALIAAVPARGASKNASGDSAVPLRTLPLPATSLLGREHDMERAVALLRASGGHVDGLGGCGKDAAGPGCCRRAAETDSPTVSRLSNWPRSGRRMRCCRRSPTPWMRGPRQAPTDPRQSWSDLVTSAPPRPDNVEHLLEVAPRIGALIEAAPGLVVLATSRAPLRIRGEVEVKVEPLDVLDDGDEVESPAASVAARARPGGHPWLGD